MMVHVTSRTVEGRFLLRPDPRQTPIAVGCLHRALRGCDLQLHAAVIASNHFHLLLSPASVDDMARFVGRFKRNLTDATQRLHGCRGSVFAQRYDAIVVSDEEESQIATLRYVLAHGCKEGVVLSPRDWPGLHAAKALANAEPLRGACVRRQPLWHARKRRGAVDEADFVDEVEVELVPPPCWAHLDDASFRARMRDLLASIEDETRSRHAADGTRPRGAAAALQALPTTTPRDEPRIACCPRFHAWRRSVRQQLIEAFGLFYAAYRRAAEALARGQPGPPFPPGCYPPRGPFVPVAGE